MAKSLKALSMLIRIGLYWFPLAILVALVPAPATATNAITGKARVIDGDTIEMAGERSGSTVSTRQRANRNALPAARNGLSAKRLLSLWPGSSKPIG